MNFTPWRRGTVDFIDQMRQEMEQVFHRFFPEQGPGARGKAAWSPQIDMEETDTGLVIKIDMPGVDAKDVEIAFAEGSLIVQGERKEERDETRKTFHMLERPVGRLYRSIPLPPATDPDKIQAQAANGVLTITVPKIPEVQPKKIRINPQSSCL